MSTSTTGTGARTGSRGTTRRTRRTLLAGTAALGAGVLAACATGTREAGVSLKVDQPVTVTMLLNGNLTGVVTDTMKKQYETLFRAANPNVTIDFQGSGSSGNEHLTKVIALSVAGTAPDLFYLSQSSDVPSLTAKNMIRALDDLIRADAKFKKEDWFEVHLGAWQFQNRQRGLPWQGGPLITYYNKELFAEAGVPAPTEATWTYDAWRDAGTKLRRVMSGGETPRWATDVGGQWIQWLYAFGADVLDKDLKKCALESKESLTALQLMADFIHRDQIALKPQDFGGKTHQQLFMEKRLAAIVMNRQNASAQGFIQPWVSVVQLPKGPAGRFSMGNIDGFGMAAETKSPAATWEAMKWRSGHELRLELFRSGNGGIPALKATANSPEYLNDKLPPEWNRMFIQSMNIVRLAPAIPQWPEINTTVAQAIDVIKRGEVAPPAAMKELAPRVNALLQSA
jgi:multiple sugar transport system substrate-binding protein